MESDVHLNTSVLRTVLRAVIIAASVLAIIILCALIFLQLNADSLVAGYRDRLAEETGCRIETGSIGLNVFPSPMLSVDGITVKEDGLTFRAEFASVRPSLFYLVRGEFRPEHFMLVRPSARGTLPFSIAEKLRQQKTAGSADSGNTLAEDAFAIPSRIRRKFLPLYCSAEIMDAEAELTDADGSRLHLRGADLSMAVRPLRNRAQMRVTVSEGSLVMGNRMWSVSKVDIDSQTHVIRPMSNIDMKVRGSASLPILSTRLRVDARITGSPEGFTTEGSASGVYVFDATPIPFEITGKVTPFTANADRPPYADIFPAAENAGAADEPYPGKDRALHLMLGKLAMGTDSAGLDAVLALREPGPEITGRLSLTKVSLTRWLSFARWITPGLQASLDQVSEGIIDFTLDSHGMKAPRVTGTAADAEFRGEGGVASWKNPVVYLNLKSREVDLGEALPEALGEPVTAPIYTHKPLSDLTSDEFWGRRERAKAPAARDAEEKPSAPAQTPAATAQTPGTAAAGKKDTESRQDTAQPDRNTVQADQDSQGGLSYDIRLSAGLIHYGKLNIRNGGVVITPQTSQRTGIRGTNLAVKTDFYGGPLTGNCFIYGTHMTPLYDITLKAGSVSAAALRKDLAVFPAAKGTMDTVIDVTSKGRTLDDFLAGLHGKISVDCAKGSFSASETNGPDGPFTDLDIDCALRRAAYAKKTLGLDGKFSVKRQGAWDAQATLDGMLWFSGQSDGMHFQNLPFTLSVKDLEKAIPAMKGKGVPLDANGTATLTSKNGTLSVTKSQITLKGLSSRASLTIQKQGQSFSVTGDIQKADVNVPEFMQANLGKKTDIPNQFRHFTGSARMAWKDRQITLSDLKTEVNGVRTTGSVTADFGRQKPDFEFKIRMAELDFSRLTGQKSGSGSKTNIPGGSQKSWNFSTMKDFSAKGTLSAGSAVFGKIIIRDLQCPLHLSDGRLTVSGLTGGFYGGTLSLNGHAVFDKGLSFGGQMAVRKFSLGDVMRAFGATSIITGQAALSADVTGSMSGPDQLTSGLNGTAHFTSGQGSFQSVDKEGKPKGKPTVFRESSGSGTITSGVLRTQDFQLKGDGMKVNGTGKFDLNTQTMNLDLNVDMPGLPLIPVYVHGPFSNPKTVVNGGKVILNTFGSLAKGVFGIFGGVFNLFRHDNSSSHSGEESDVY